MKTIIFILHFSDLAATFSAVDSGGAGGARAPPEFGGSEKGRGLISAYRSLAITTNTPGFKKLNTALPKNHIIGGVHVLLLQTVTVSGFLVAPAPTLHTSW